MPSKQKDFVDSFFSNYFKNDNDTNEIIINDRGINFIESDRTPFNKIEHAQLEYTKKVFDSNRMQFILFFVATIILIGMVLLINVSGNLSFFVIIILIIIIFIIFKFLKFNMLNFILNFRI